ncbi:MAG: alpha/beta hydrolase-fold protein, partial [Bacteroidota bacterium]
MIRKIQLILILNLLSFQILAQDSPTSFGERISFNSEILNEEREIWIYTTEYYDFSEDSYPVLYLLDAETQFGHITAMVDYLSAALRIPELIIVGIPNIDRVRDFTPIHSFEGLDGKVDSTLFMNSGGGDNFLSFLREELIPFVDKNYRTQPYRILEGHSLGGMFTTYTLQKEPELFQASITISPAFYGKNTQTLSKFSERIRHLELKSKMFLSIGSEPRLQPGLDSLIYILSSVSSDSLEWDYRKYLDDDHASVVHISTHDGLRYIFKDWWIDLNDPSNLPSYKEIQKHFKQL